MFLSSDIKRGIFPFSGLRPARGFTLYCASKAALNMLTSGLAQELGPVGVRVNTISPGLTLTSFADAVVKDAHSVFTVRFRIVFAATLSRTVQTLALKVFSSFNWGFYTKIL